MSPNRTLGRLLSDERTLVKHPENDFNAFGLRSSSGWNVTLLTPREEGVCRRWRACDERFDENAQTTLTAAVCGRKIQVLQLPLKAAAPDLLSQGQAVTFPT